MQYRPSLVDQSRKDDYNHQPVNRSPNGQDVVCNDIAPPRPRLTFILPVWTGQRKAGALRLKWFADGGEDRRKSGIRGYVP
jgi:hypothetical protein